MTSQKRRRVGELRDRWITDHLVQQGPTQPIMIAQGVPTMVMARGRITEDPARPGVAIIAIVCLRKPAPVKLRRGNSKET